MFMTAISSGRPVAWRSRAHPDLRFTEHALSRALSGPVTLGSGPTVVQLTAARKGAYFARLQTASTARRPFYLRIAGVRITRQPGVSYEVHLDPQAIAAPDRTSRSYVGTINVFGAIVHGAGNGPDRRPTPTRATTVS